MIRHASSTEVIVLVVFGTMFLLAGISLWSGVGVGVGVGADNDDIMMLVVAAVVGSAVLNVVDVRIAWMRKPSQPQEIVVVVVVFVVVENKS